MDMSWLVGGGDPQLVSNAQRGTTNAAISGLSSSNIGAQGAQNASRVVGRRYQNEVDSYRSNPNISGNAAVLSGLENRASETAGAETSTAYEKGAATDLEAKAKAGEMGIQEGNLDLEYDKENYDREQAQSFGNSFLGGALKQAIGYAGGAATEFGLKSLFPDPNKPKPKSPADEAMGAMGFNS